jgi:hypothetical protein
MYSVRSVLSKNRTGFSVSGPCGGYITRITPEVGQFSGEDSHGNFVELKCDLKILFMCNTWSV